MKLDMWGRAANDNIEIVDMAAHETVAEVYHLHDERRAESLARLFAAAPDLLAACKRLVTANSADGPDFECDCDSIVPCFLCEARAAIARAEGMRAPC